MMSLEEYKTRVLNVLIKIDKICRENAIEYYAIGGTLLGAVRHNGFIPWDDDVDIMMTYENYDKLSAIIRSGLCDLNFIDIRGNKDTIFLYGKVCDTHTVIRHEGNLKVPNGYGAYVDIFPIVNFSNNSKKRKREIKKQIWIRRIVENSARVRYTKDKNLFVTFKRMIAFYFCKLINIRKTIEKADRDFRKTKRTNWAGIVTFPFVSSFLDYETVDLLFEGHPIMAPKNWNEILRYAFGDYMQLPPENERIPKHFIDCEVIDK